MALVGVRSRAGDAEAPVSAPPAGASEPASQPGSGANGVPSRRALMLRYEDPGATGPRDPKVVVKVAMGGSTVDVTLTDDGSPPDGGPGDRVWSGTAEVDQGVDAIFALGLDGAQVVSLQSRVDPNEQLPQVVFRREGGSVKASDVADDVAPTPLGPPGPGIPAGEGRGPPQPEAQGPANLPATTSSGGAEGEVTLPRIWPSLVGLAVGVAVAVWGPLRRRRARANLRPLVARTPSAGLPLQAGAPLALVTRASEARALLDAVVDALSCVRHVVVLRAEGRDDRLPRGGGAWSWRTPRPDPFEVVRACGTLDAPVLLCEGAEALEAPLGTEGPNAVVEEFLQRARAYPVVLVLAADAPLPAGVRVVTVSCEGDVFVSAELPGVSLGLREPPA